MIFGNVKCAFPLHCNKYILGRWRSTGPVEQNRKPRQNFEMSIIKRQEHLAPFFGGKRQRNKRKALPTGFSDETGDNEDELSEL